MFVLTLLSKSIAVVLPVLFFALDQLEKRKITTRMVLEKVPFFILSLGMGLFTAQGYSNHLLHPPEIFSLSLLRRGIWAAKGLVFYLYQFVYPLKLSAYYDIRLIHLSNHMYIPVLILGLLLFVYCITPGLRSKGATFGMMFFVLALVPVLKIIPFGEYSIFNDRYLYLSSIGLLFFVVGTAHQFLKSKKGYKGYLAPVFLFFIVILVCTQGLFTSERSLVWADGESLWKDVLEKYPGTAMAHNNLGRVYFERGDWPLALGEFQKARDARPDLDKAYYNLGLVAEHLSQFEDAATDYKKAIELNPSYAEAHNNLGNYYSRRGAHSNALNEFLLGIQAGAQFKEIYFNAAWSYKQLGKMEEARHLLSQIPNE